MFARYQDLVDSAHAFNVSLSDHKRRHPEAGWSYYPYDTIGAFLDAAKLLFDHENPFQRLTAESRIADFGCGDGDLSFYLASQGYAVDAFDFALTNYNRMMAVRKMQNVLQANVSIHEIDFNGPFTLPSQRYDLAFFLGILYHLKNPFAALEALAQRARYCVLSTRIAERSTDGRMTMKGQPVAYLLDEAESNGDDTNFWIFSEEGLRRILQLTGWQVRGFVTVGCAKGSDPVRLDRDQRAYCLLQSRYLAREDDVVLQDGWYELEEDRFRWTARRFSVLLRIPAQMRPGSLELTFHLPDHAPLPMRLTTRTEGQTIAQDSIAAAGGHSVRVGIPEQMRGLTELRVEWEWDRTVSSKGDTRELGCVVPFVVLRAGRYEFAPPVQVLPR